MLSWDDFLAKVADKHSLFDEDHRQAFLKKLDQESLNKSKSDAQVATELNISEVQFQRRLQKAYEAFSQTCLALKSNNKKGKLNILRNWLKGGYRDYQETGLLPWLIEIPSEVSQKVSVTHTTIDWHDICDKVLATQQLRRQATAQQYELNIYVSLGLMERPKTPNPRQNPTGEDSRSQQEPELQIVQTYKDDALFQKVIAENRTEKRKHIAIIGEPGAGKTTLLGELAERLPKNSPDFPICIRLADLRESTIEDYLLHNWLKKALQFIDADAENVTPEIRKALKQLFRQGKVWLLLDGVDEMAAESPVQALARIREQLTDWVGKARVVLTCRLNVWDATISNTLTDFDTYKTLEFEPDDVDKFICQWFEQASQDEKRRNSGNETYWLEQGKRLQQELKEPGKDNIRRMVRNPLRLSMLCQSWCVPKPYLPETKAALYEQFTTYFFEWKQEEFQKKHQQVLKETEKKQIQQALEKLALAAMESANRFRIEQEFAIEQMEEEWFNLADELGWLVLVDRDTRTKKPVYAFYHPTFQEYFVACAIEDWHYFLNHQIPPVSDRYRIFERQWREIILLWLGRREIEAKQKEEFIDALVNFEDGCGEWSYQDKVDKGCYEYRAYFLVAAAIAEFHDYSQIDEIIGQIVKWRFGYFDTQKQKWVKFFNVISNAAMEALQQTHRPKAIAALVERLNSHDLRDYIRGEVATSLGKIGQGNQTAIDALVQQLNSPTLNHITWEVTLSLEKIARGNQKAIAAFEQLLKLNLYGSARCLVPATLGCIDPGNQKAIAALEQLLDSSILDDDSRRLVAVILKEIDPGNQKAIPALEELLTSGAVNDDDTRREVAASLGKIDPGNQKAIDTLVQQLITSAFDEEYDSTSGQVAVMLEEIGQGNQKVIDALVELLTSGDLNNYTRREVAASLAKIDPGNQKAIDALEELLTSGAVNDDDTRREVAASLGKIDPGNQKAIDALVQLLNSPYLGYSIRRLVAESLGNIDPGNKNAIAALVELLNSPHLDDFTRREVAESLREIDRGNQKAIDALVQLLNSLHRNDLTFLRVIQNLGNIGQDNQTAIDALVQLLSSTNLARGTRWQVAETLEKMKLDTDKQCAVITALKANFNDSQQIDERRYKLIWHCAQNLPYLDFYSRFHVDKVHPSSVQSL